MTEGHKRVCPGKLRVEVEKFLLGFETDNCALTTARSSFLHWVDEMHSRDETQ